MLTRAAAVLLIFATAAAAQQWKLGADIGYGVYRNGSIFAPAANGGARAIFQQFTLMFDVSYVF